MMMKDGLTKRVRLVLGGISKEEPAASTQDFLSLWEKSGERGEDTVYRRGKFFRFCMGQIVTPVYDNEIIVGDFPYREWDCNCCCLPDTIATKERELAIAEVGREFLERAKLKKVPDFEKWNEVFWGGINFGHVIVDYEKVLQVGFGGLEKEIEKRLEDPNLEAGQRSFLSSARETVLGCELLIRRYGEEALRLAETAEPGRAGELREIGSVCKRIAEQPASGFREAVQLIWFIQLLLEIESGVSAFSYGRMDQYL